ncbi:histidine phosphatase family protein [Fructilactobacillus fructivorans]|uniref:Phosphoglycerate mutase family n=1 Tax=Fructilactobacillus fructivorans TaxID=1614 RepID=A0A0C1PQV0_9LACO|nr:histidine phosphatase family protein [Fructilactobacillus fructivorans]KID42246.1 Phosphoglycerate mutase family [Fructilactobacillus fructivorans]MCT0151128.1 histidine phosphatase family protein [Fructilactobacillus fructivorans]MCT2867314.1 histidine phosphatase family protein [Fructilactobacillus fructivorans]MCT2869166.1 histidine phosphatase family protein [Fructilactobacillus fructivorans]MCT2873113.1 histidine phosphatase family protein [Fructilactobacillus fructivorans]
MKVTAYLVRHGQTYMNLYNKVQGWIDSPLTKKGLEDADNAGERLKDINFDAAFSSDSGRAIQTAHHILQANNNNINIISYQFPELREQFHGYFEGENLEQMWQFVGEQVKTTSEAGVLKNFGLEKARDLIAKADLYNNAEDNKTFWKRVDRGIDRIRKNTKDGDKILIVSHGMTIRSIVDRYNPALDIGEPAKNGSITKLIITDKDIKVEYFNNLGKV